MAAVLIALVALAPLAERHRAFVEDEAHFLLTVDERARFDDLATDALKDRYIDAFWDRWDRDEQRERLEACDRTFGARGRWSERGRVYQLLGPPSFREVLARAGGRIVPVELWHYTGVEVSFLPEAFYLIFFQRGGAGDYRLWSPASDGVAALVPSAEPGGFDLGVEPGLERIDPELALAVEGLVPGGAERDALSLLASVDAFPVLYGMDRVFGVDVRVAVSMRRLSVALSASVETDDAGVPELHYAADVASGASAALDWRAHGESYRVRFTLVGRVLAAEGAIERERWEDEIEIEVGALEKQSLLTTRLSFRGRRVVQPGDARLQIALVTDGAGAVVEAPIAAPDAGVAAAPAPGAVRVLERARTQAEEARYRYARGVALARRGDRARAIEEMTRAVELDIDDVRVHLERARLLFVAGRRHEVLDDLGAIAPRFPDEIDLWVLMAGAAEALGRFRDAERFYERAAELAPDDRAIAEALSRARAHAN